MLFCDPEEDAAPGSVSTSNPIFAELEKRCRCSELCGDMELRKQEEALPPFK